MGPAFLFRRGWELEKFKKNPCSILLHEETQIRRFTENIHPPLDLVDDLYVYLSRGTVSRKAEQISFIFLVLKQEALLSKEVVAVALFLLSVVFSHLFLVHSGLTGLTHLILIAMINDDSSNGVDEDPLKVRHV